MTFLMLLDHLRYIQGLTSPEAASFFTLISRCAAPMFAYLAVEGIRHTRDLKRYCIRLSVMAGIMFAGNAVLNMFFRTFSGSLSAVEQRKLLINHNAFFTLALGVLTIALILKAKEEHKRKLFYVIPAVCFVTGFLYGEWGTVLLPFMMLEYFAKNKKRLRLLGYGIIEVIALLLPFSEPFYFLVFPFILLYNGQRGPKNRFSKYFFYVFYPLHLWIIYLVNFIITMN